MDCATKEVCCRDCAGFIFDEVGDGYGLGECLEYEEYKAKNPGNAALRRALIQLGNKIEVDGRVLDLFWGGTAKDRKCSKFKPTDKGLVE